jgi:hypothetical protein
VAKERDLNPGFLLLLVKKCKPSYPSDTSNAKADRNDKAFLFVAKERDLNPGFLLLLVKKCKPSYPSDTSNAKLTEMIRLFCLWRRKGI